jgi:hypothetical protein
MFGSLLALLAEALHRGHVDLGHALLHGLHPLHHPLHVGFAHASGGLGLDAGGEEGEDGEMDESAHGRFSRAQV